MIQAEFSLRFYTGGSVIKNKSIAKKIIALFFTTIFIYFTAFFIKCTVIPENKLPEKLVIMSYNVFNLFDDISSGNEYSEYNPANERWTSELYAARLKNTSNVIKKSHPPNGPDIICFQEVEGKKVLEDLAKWLSAGKYKYIEWGADNESAITTGIISRYPLKNIKRHSIELIGFENLRNVLEVQVYFQKETEEYTEAEIIPLYIFNCHFKSKLGGTMETEPARIAAAVALQRRCAEILTKEPNAEIIVAGDLNENIDEYERQGRAFVTALMPASAAGETNTKVIFYTGNEEEISNFTEVSLPETVFFSPWDNKKGEGSYFYRSSWETIDHFLLTSSLFNNKGFEYREFKVFNSEEFTDKTGKPFRWNSNIENGYSDHFPILLYLEAE